MTDYSPEQYREYYETNRDAKLSQVRAYQATPEYKAAKKEYDKNRRKDPQVQARVRDLNLQKNFGITLAQYNEMLENQNNLCALCETDNPGGRGSFHVDHCHKTGKVRGLLCHSCNVGLGHFRDSPEKLQKAMQYLERCGYFA